MQRKEGMDTPPLFFTHKSFSLSHNTYQHLNKSVGGIHPFFPPHYPERYQRSCSLHASILPQVKTHPRAAYEQGIGKSAHDPRAGRSRSLAQAITGQARVPQVGRQPKGMSRPSEYEERVIHKQPPPALFSGSASTVSSRASCI